MNIKNTVFPESNWVQDSSKSIILEDGTYDFERFSDQETSVIMSVFNLVQNKYPPIYRAIGLANESNQILYKPRYVLFESIIQVYSDSSNPLDNVAVAIAYETKGAQFRQSAIKHFEIAESHISSMMLNKFFISLPYSFYLKFSYLYEKEYRYEKALELTEKAVQYSDNKENCLADRIEMLKNKIENPPKQRKRRVKESEIILEKKIANSAAFFIQKTQFI